MTGSPEHFENIWLIWCHKLCTWIFIINQHFLVIHLLTSTLASEVVEKNNFVLGIFCYSIWLNLVSRAKIKFFYNFTNYIEPPRSLKIVQIKFSHIKWLKMLKTTTSEAKMEVKSWIFNKTLIESEKGNLWHKSWGDTVKSYHTFGCFDQWFN